LIIKKTVKLSQEMSRADRIELGKELFKYSVKMLDFFTASIIDKKIAEYTNRYPDLDTLSITFKVLNNFAKLYSIEWRELI
jgi:hypothetical protein